MFGFELSDEDMDVMKVLDVMKSCVMVLWSEFVFVVFRNRFFRSFGRAILWLFFKFIVMDV